jgi:glycosyltransferase involved in cell wall biosynthesis
MTEAKIAAAICTYDRYDLLPKAIDSLTKQTLGSDAYKILVVDNSPDHDGASTFSKRLEAVANLTYIVEKTPGLSNARNVSAALCATPYIAFIDDDAIASPGWLEAILTVFEGHGSRTDIVGGRVNPIWGAPRPPWLHDAMLASLSIVDYGDATRPAAAEEWFAGTNVAFRTSAILSNGGFATNLGRVGSGISLLSNEEVELVGRIRAAGGESIYAPLASVHHLVDPQRLTRAWFRKRYAWQAVSDLTMDPDRFADAAKDYWKGILGYFNSLPPHLRTVRGLLHQTDNPEVFRRQCGAVYMITGMVLAGCEDVLIEHH